jgi:hypothetical protein
LGNFLPRANFDSRIASLQSRALPQTSTRPSHFPKRRRRRNRRDCRLNKHRSRWFLGPCGFVLRKRQPLPFIKWKGALGLREVPSRLLGRISPRLLRNYRAKGSPRRRA